MGERGIFYSLLRDKKSGVFGTLKVLLKDNVSTNYVADCWLITISTSNITEVKESQKKEKRNVLCESKCFQKRKLQNYHTMFNSDLAGSLETDPCPILREYWTGNEVK